MKLAAAFLFLGLACAGADELTPKQMAGAECVECLTVPTPAEFFSAIDKAAKPDWAAFYRPPGPTTYPTRPQTAVNLGALVADGFVAVEAEDGQQVKNTGTDIITLARALGVGDNVLSRGKSISDFADKNDWFALREELEATANEVRHAMQGQRDQALSALISAGAWLRALQVGSRAAGLSGEDRTAELLSQTELVGRLRADLEALPETARTGPVIAQVTTILASVGETMAGTTEETSPPEKVAAIKQQTDEFIGQMGSNQP